MKLHEYQAKEIFSRYGISTSPAELATTPQEAEAIVSRRGKPVVVKAQVLVGGRGKAGGIKLAKTPQEAAAAAKSILGMSISGEVVKKILVAEAVEIQKELYLGLVIDRSAKRVAIMASSLGGVDIEQVARESPQKIARTSLHPFLELRDFQARELGMAIGLEKSLLSDFVVVARTLYRIFTDLDCSLAEINPLAITPAGKLVAVDAKLVVDDNALFRHPDLAALRDEASEDPREVAAQKHGLSYVKLNGNIGCLVNGAGLAMATMDVIKLYGGEPANFLDVGGGAREERVAQALRILLSDPQVEAVLINIFGGITRCDEVARGILAALQEAKITVPIVTRLVGTNQEEGQKILAEAQMITAVSLSEAAQKAVALVRS